MALFPTVETLTLVTNPLPAEKLHVRTVIGSEELGKPFEYTVELLRELKSSIAGAARLALEPPIDPELLLGKEMSLRIDISSGDSLMPDERARFVHGIVTSVEHTGLHERHQLLSVTLSPTLSLLEHKGQSRIFQETTVPDLIKAIFKTYGFEPESRLDEAKHRRWDYLTQYRESDFAFVNRLMQLEGIYYFFLHEEGRHKMVLVEDRTSHLEEVPGYEVLRMNSAGAGVDLEALTSFDPVRHFRSGRATLAEFDFRMRYGGANQGLEASAPTGPATGDELSHHVYDYPGKFVVGDDKPGPEADGDVEASQKAGEHYATVHLEEIRSTAYRYKAQGTVRGLQVGSTFTIDPLDRPASADQKFVVVSTDYEFRNREFHAGADDADWTPCHVTMTAMSQELQFRTARTVPKPIIAGPQTAIVVGDGNGGDISTDVHGRVRVRFPWYHEDPYKWQGDIAPPQTTSCWVRVAQVWAGSGWGGIFVPRVGQEVIVQFLEGDPDRPIITGSVYNTNNEPPYKLGAGATRSGIKTRSTGGTATGGKDPTPANYNELYFEDKIGEEQLYMQAERNMDTLVKVNQTNTVNGDRTLTVGGNETHTVKKERKLTVTGKDTEIFEDHRDSTVTKDDKLTVSDGNKSTSVDTGGYKIETKAYYELQQGGAENRLFIKEEVVLETKGRAQMIGQSGKTSVDLKDGVVTVTAAQGIAFKCGAATITMKDDGTIEIKGKIVKAGNDQNNIAFESAGTTMNGQKITSAAPSGVHQIVGTTIKIG